MMAVYVTVKAIPQRASFMAFVVLEMGALSSRSCPVRSHAAAAFNAPHRRQLMALFAHPYNLKTLFFPPASPPKNTV